MTLFFKLLLAHLIGDFFLQTTRMVNSKEHNKIKSPYLYLHCLIHILLTLLITWDLSFWPYALFIGLSHFIIDAAKLYLQRPHWRVASFLVDQFLHLLILITISLFYNKAYLTIDMDLLFDNQKLFFYTCLLFLTTPCSIFIKTAISSWSPQNFEEQTANGSLQNAGKWIGNLERLLVFIFVVLGRWEAVGFLLAAKSIFRFGDLKNGEDRRLTEYVLIGTLLSFGIAILTGIVYLNLSLA